MVANDLLVIAISWTAVSIALHQLLTFYADRPAALVAAHKKFLVSRLADGSLAVSLWLLHANVGSFDLDRIAAWMPYTPLANAGGTPAINVPMGVDEGAHLPVGMMLSGDFGSDALLVQLALELEDARPSDLARIG